MNGLHVGKRPSSAPLSTAFRSCIQDALRPFCMHNKLTWITTWVRNLYTILICSGLQLYRNDLIAHLVDGVYGWYTQSKKYVWNIRSLPETDQWLSVSYLMSDTNLWGYPCFFYDEDMLYEQQQNINGPFEDVQNKQEDCLSIMDVWTEYANISASTLLVNDDVLMSCQLSPNQCMYRTTKAPILVDETHAIPSTACFFAVEYNHPTLSVSLLSPSAYLVGNQLLSRVFVKRALEYEYGDSVVFDKQYTVILVDDQVNIVRIHWNQYVEITVDGYIVKTI